MSNMKSIKLMELHSDSIESARKLCNYEDPKRIEEAVDILEDWIKKQNHFLRKDFPRIYLETSLISNKGSIERTKTKLDKLCTLRTLLPQFYKYTDIRKYFKDMFSCATMVPLPKLTQDHYRVLTINIQNNKYFHSLSFTVFYNMLFIFCDLLKIYDYSNGVIAVFDYRDINVIDVISKLNLVETKQVATLIVDGYSMRIKGIYFITSSKTIETLVKIIKPFFPAKIAERIQIFPTLESLHTALPKNILPVELGGAERSRKELQSDWIEQLSSDETMDYLNWIRQTGVNESYRIDEKYSEYTGLAGTFRTLNVD